MPLPSGEKGLWLAIVGGLVLSVLVWGVLVTALVGIRDDGPPGDSISLVRPIFYTLGALLLLIAATVFRRKVGTPGLPVVAFRTHSIVSLALAEACAVLGLALFFMTRSFLDVALMAGASLALVLLYIVPAGLRYFEARERETRGPPPSSPASAS